MELSVVDVQMEQNCMFVDRPGPPSVYEIKRCGPRTKPRRTLQKEWLSRLSGMVNRQTAEQVEDCKWLNA